MAETSELRNFRSLLCALLLSAAAALCAQSGGGALAGRLTDLYSHPVGSATLHLRNQSTGEEQQTTSGKNGAYFFRGLTPGLYTLRVKSATLGQGELSDLSITADREQQLRTALEFTHEGSSLSAMAWSDFQKKLQQIRSLKVGVPEDAFFSVRLTPEPLVEYAPPDRSFPAQSQAVTRAEKPGARALPVRQRNWASFLPDHPAASEQSVISGGIAADGSGRSLIDMAAERRSDVEQNAENVEAWNGARQRLVNESSLRMVRNAETRQGTNSFHGEGYLLNRTSFLGARNPYTQRMKETSAATGSSIPTFTAEPWTPPDRETSWGISVGRALRWERYFWFATVEGRQKNDPAASMVKHPDLFFAQPSNDQLQVLAARMNLSSMNPVSEGAAQYSKKLEGIVSVLGEAPRTTRQWSGFLRLDGKVGERQQLMVKTSSALRNSAGGGMSEAAEPYGVASLGNRHSSELWTMGRWESWLRENLRVVSQLSWGRTIQTMHAETPSVFEKSFLSGNAWGQLPQIVVDSRYGFTMGNPARFGWGSNPDERQWQAQEQFSRMHAGVLLRAGVELRHARDNIGRLRNQTGSYSYSSVENFVSDALAFDTYGINPPSALVAQPYCDPTGKVWRDSAGALHGMGSLPCYSSYTQTIGPAGWWLSSNDWAGYGSLQWQALRGLVLSVGVRWEREQAPPPYSLLASSDLSLAGKIPSLGNQWGPRAALAWKRGRWPVLQLGYGLYFGRTANETLLTALTNTGSTKGDLHFLLRPTDNLSAGGAPPFPAVLTGEPGTVIKPGVIELSPTFRNPRIHQAEASVEFRLPKRWEVTVAGELSLGRNLPVSFDTNIDQAVNPGTITYAVKDATALGPLKSTQLTVPFYATWVGSMCAKAKGVDAAGRCGRLNPNYQQVDELFSGANSTWEAAEVRIHRVVRKGLSLHLRYTYSHAMDWNPEEELSPGGASVFDPAQYRQEYGSGDMDARHVATWMAVWRSPWKLRGALGPLTNRWTLSAVGNYRSGFPYSMRIAEEIPKEFVSGVAISGLSDGMNGYGGNNLVYGVGRNTYRYPAVWKADMRLSRSIDLNRRRRLEVLAESFNLFNHSNVFRRETTGYYLESGSTSGGLPSLNFMSGTKSGTTEFGQPLNVNATSSWRERQFDFGIRMHF